MFGKSTTNRLVDESRSIVDIFTGTINRLRDVNARADEQHSKKEKEKEEIELEMTQLKNLRENNSRVMEKIEKILE
jgi:hypothetical protein